MLFGLRQQNFKKNKIMILYEVWVLASYKRTDYMFINASGAVTMSPKTIPFQLRLTPRDEIVIENNQHILYMTDFEYGNSKIV